MSSIHILAVEQFEKDFEIVSRISEGKFGKVFRARRATTREAGSSSNLFFTNSTITSAHQCFSLH
jgi:hypothetical protein